MKPNQATIPQNNLKQEGGQLGTFAGVFTPSILTILGIILFLRLGYVTGSAGLMRAFMIIALANTISVLTTFSLSAISTNLKVKGGGDYYVISRTLGLEFGGALGLVLYLAQSVSIAFYCIGFGEACFDILPPSINLTPQLIALIAVSFLFVIAWLGSDWASRFQFGVMALLVAALFSFFWGGIANFHTARLFHNWSAPANGESFWVLFAIFFPAVTGFTQGVSMSGDLKDPGKSLPTGTFMAVGISIIVYFSVALIFSACFSNAELMTNYQAMKQTATFPFLIDAGVIAATLSSAIASYLGAPRILQSLAADRIFPFLSFFAKGEGSANNPRRGVLLSTLIAFLTIAMGNLNLVASIVSMFFLISYGLLNYATYFEATTRSPSFRPSFKWFSPFISLAGCLFCLGTMMAIDVKNSLVAVAILFSIYQYLKRTAPTSRWSDSKRSHLLQQIRDDLIKVAAEPAHDRDWRPRIIALCNDKQRKKTLLEFASWIEGESGIITALWIIEGDGIEINRQRRTNLTQLTTDLKELHFPVHPLVVSSPALENGLSVALQSFGIGPINANTLLLNWFDKAPTALEQWKEIRLVKNVRAAFRLGCNVIIFSGRFMADMDEKCKHRKDMKIDIWWYGDATSRLMLLFAYLTKRHEIWENAEIRVLAAHYKEDTEAHRQALKREIDESRITADCKIIVDTDIDSLAQMSMHTDLVFAPFRFKYQKIVDPYGQDIQSMIIQLKNVALFKAADDIDLDAEPEEGRAADMAEAMDAVDRIKERAKLAEKQAEKMKEQAAQLRKKLTDLKHVAESEKEFQFIEKMEKDLMEADEGATKAARKAIKESAKAAIAEKDMSATVSDK